MRKGRGRVTASPVPETLKFITSPSFPTQPPALTAGQDRTEPNPPIPQHEKRANHPECVRQATNTYPRQSLPQQRARPAHSLENRFENRRPPLKSPQSPGPGAHSGEAPRPQPPSPTSGPRGRGCPMVPSAPAGCRQSQGPVPLVGQQRPEKQARSSTRSLPTAGPARGAPGAMPRPGPRARPAPASAEGTGERDTAQRRDGHPCPARGGRDEPRETRSERQGTGWVVSAQLCGLWAGFDIAALSECRFHREHGSPLRARTLQEGEAKVPRRHRETGFGHGNRLKKPVQIHNY